MSAKVYQIVTEKIVQLLEQGVVPWWKPWAGGPSMERPMNLKSGKEYRGINLILLMAAGYSSRYWLTYKQANEMGGQVRKGEKSSLIVFYKRIEVEDEQSDGTTKKRNVPMLRYYNVFNLDQVEGIEAPDTAEAPIGDFTPIECAKRIIDEMPNPPEIRHEEPRAFYRAVEDLVNLPEPKLFHSPEHYYSTAFHELTHSTGHESRLNRRPSTVLRYFGDKEYSYEELVAEMGAAFLSGKAGIEQEVIENQASYLQNWIEVLRGDPKLVVKAASAAQAAADFILAEQQ